MHMHARVALMLYHDIACTTGPGRARAAGWTDDLSESESVSVEFLDDDDDDANDPDDEPVTEGAVIPSRLRRSDSEVWSGPDSCQLCSLW